MTRPASSRVTGCNYSDGRNSQPGCLDGYSVSDRGVSSAAQLASKAVCDFEFESWCRLSNVNLLQEFKDYLLDSETMSRHSAIDRDQMWAAFETMLLQARPTDLDDGLLQARSTLFSMRDCELAEGFGQGFRVEEPEHDA